MKDRPKYQISGLSFFYFSSKKIAFVKWGRGQVPPVEGEEQSLLREFEGGTRKVLGLNKCIG